MSRVLGEYTVQSLWVGRRLSPMERLSIASFLSHGHEFHLYCYEQIENAPPGTVLKDGNEILPESAIFTYRKGFAAGSPAAFSNFFRYKLLLDRGGLWVDTDVVCLRPFDFADDRLLGSERESPPQEHPRRFKVSSSVIKAQPGDELMEWAWLACQRRDTEGIRFGDIGPRLLGAGVKALGIQACVRPCTFFSPIAFHDWGDFLNPRLTFFFGMEVHGVHLWNQMWAAAGVDKSGTFPAECLYERLKRRYLSG